MSLQFGPTKIGAMQYNGVTIGEAMYNGQIVYKSELPTVTITGTTGNASMNQFRSACIEYGTTYQTVGVLPFQLDTSQATNLQNLFYGCSALTSVPDLDTVNVTRMSNMFRNCSLITTVPSMNTSWATDMARMFNGCSALTFVPDMSTSTVTDMTEMFYDCSSLTDGNVRLIGKHPSVNTLSMITGSGLTRNPFFNGSGNPI